MLLNNKILFIILGIGVFILFSLIGYLVDVYKNNKMSKNNEIYNDCVIIDSEIDINVNDSNEDINKDLNNKFDNKDELLNDYDKMDVNS